MSTTLEEAEKKARVVVKNWSIAATAVSWIPGSAIVLSGADIVLIKNVADAFEVKDYNVVAAIGATGAAAGGKMLAESCSVVPIAGWIAKAVIAGSITKALGEGLIAYFKGQSPLSATTTDQPNPSAA